MSKIQDFRSQATEQRQAAQSMLDASDFDTSPRKQVIATVGFVHACVLEDLATLFEELTKTPSSSEMTTTEFNHRLRLSAAKGDWDEFSRLVSER